MALGDGCIKEVLKKWGCERWLVNCAEYCSKIMLIDKGARSSWHYHKKKKETFSCLDGEVVVFVEGKGIIMHPWIQPITILPGQKHGFLAFEDSVLLEISTHHEEDDVVRLTESESGS